MTYGVAFVVRPLGGIVFGALGDVIGRKNVLIATLLVMGIGTSSDVIVERWNGIPFEQPYQQVRDMVRFPNIAVAAIPSTGAPQWTPTRPFEAVLPSARCPHQASRAVRRPWGLQDSVCPLGGGQRMAARRFREP